MKIGIIGPGKLGKSLCKLLSACGHQVRLYGREGTPDEPVVLLTVPDRELSAVAATIAPGRVLLHCSGASEFEILRPHRPAGSFHPLMTFPGIEIGLPHLKDVPVAIAGDEAAQHIAETLAKDLEMKPFRVPGSRSLYHAAAVMAGNFSTALLASGAQMLTAAGVPAKEAPALLLPLAIASLTNAQTDPANSLTGPAARNDQSTIDEHRAALQKANLEHLLESYDVMTSLVKRLKTNSNF